MLKHSHHPIDVAGKDTERLRRCGSEIVVFASKDSVIFSDWEPLELAAVLPVDVVLIEGFHARRFPGRRFVVRRPQDVDRVASAIDGAAAPSGRRPSLKAGRRRAPAGDLWELVANLMERSGIHRLALTSPRVSAQRRARTRTR